MELKQLSLKRTISFEGITEEQTVIIDVEKGDTITSLYQFGSQCFAQMTPKNIQQIAAGAIETKSVAELNKAVSPPELNTAPLPEKPKQEHPTATIPPAELEDKIRAGYEFKLPKVGDYGYFSQQPDSKFNVTSFNVSSQTIGIKDVHTGQLYSPPFPKFKTWVDTSASGTAAPEKTFLF
jgi:hypothetical protein